MAMDFFLCVLGMVFFIEGLPLFGAPRLMKQALRQILEMSDDTLRWFGVVSMGLGVMLVWLGRI